MDYIQVQSPSRSSNDINDNTVSANTTWSSQKIDNLLANLSSSGGGSSDSNIYLINMRAVINIAGGLHSSDKDKSYLEILEAINSNKLIIFKIDLGYRIYDEEYGEEIFFEKITSLSYNVDNENNRIKIYFENIKFHGASFIEIYIKNDESLSYYLEEVKFTIPRIIDFEYNDEFFYIQSNQVLNNSIPITSISEEYGNIKAAVGNGKIVVLRAKKVPDGDEFYAEYEYFYLTRMTLYDLTFENINSFKHRLQVFLSNSSSEVRFICTQTLLDER